MLRSFWYLKHKGVSFSSVAFKFGSYPEELTDSLLYEATSVYFFTLVIMQWGLVHSLFYFTYSWSERACGRELK